MNTTQGCRLGAGMLDFLKRLAALLPASCQQGLKRHYYRFQHQLGVFGCDEPEYQILGQFVSPGDWVVDIGANIGHYTAKLSELVGADGRVFAIEPFPETFEILTANAQFFPFSNVTLLNVAASDKVELAGMDVPLGETGLKVHGLAHITRNESPHRVFCLPIDSLRISQQISLVKIDTEGHELAVLSGMEALLRHCQPTLIVEANEAAVVDFLKEFGYEVERITGSPNYIFRFARVRENTVSPARE